MKIFSTRFLCFVVFLELAPSIQAAEKSLPDSAVNFVRRILNDPLVAPAARNAQLVLKDKGISGQVITVKYDLPSPLAYRLKTQNSCVFYLSTNRSGYDFNLSLANNDITELKAEPNWEKMVAQWDAFANRYWPGVRRETDWRKARFKFKSSAPVFSLHYVTKKQEVQLNSITLNVRLTDGKIGGIYALDFAANLPKTSIPPPPSKEKVLASIKRALPRAKYLPTGIVSQTLQITKMRRGYSRLGLGNMTVFTQNRFGFNVNTTVIGKTTKGRIIEIMAQYDEKTQQSEITGSGYVDELGEDEKGEALARKVFTLVADSKPLWSSETDTLWFNSTRDVKGRPWWERDSLLLSIALQTRDRQTLNELRLVRPIKSLSNDFISYVLSVSSPTGRFLSLTSQPQYLSILDTQKGVLYFPEPDAATRARILENGGRPEDIEPLRLQIAGAAWLNSENGLVLSITNRDCDPNLYVARWAKDAPPQEMELIPVVVELGEDVLPELSGDGKTLAWARKIYKRERDKVPGEKDRWQLHLADFDAENLITTAPRPQPGEIVVDKEAIAKANNRNRRTLDLSDEPLSIAWDETQKRWLIVTRTQVLWVREDKTNANNALQVLAAPPLNWNSIQLKATSADVSRDGKIAIAGELETPKVYAKTECVVRSLVFLWDGQSSQVKPAYEPSLNGLPRFQFPTGSSWARIRGDAKRLGLEGSADAVWFDAANVAALP